MKEEQMRFLKSFDFLRLGQAVNHGQWQSAAMTLRRMESQAKQAGFSEFERPFAGLRTAILRKNPEEAKQILARVVAKRVQLLDTQREPWDQTGQDL